MLSVFFPQSVSTQFHPSVTKLQHHAVICIANTERKHFPVKILSNQWGLSPPLGTLLLVLSLERACFTDPTFRGYFNLLISAKWQVFAF